MLRLVVLEQVASRHEVENEWALEDILNAHMVLDLKHDAHRKERRRVDAERRKGRRHGNRA